MSQRLPLSGCEFLIWFELQNFVCEGEGITVWSLEVSYNRKEAEVFHQRSYFFHHRVARSFSQCYTKVLFSLTLTLFTTLVLSLPNAEGTKLFHQGHGVCWRSPCLHKLTLLAVF
jgi:hypothetical protein